MGRELKRVPLTFDWPQNKIWEGYVNPYYSQRIKCPHCEGSGSSPEYKRLHSLWYSHLDGGFVPEMRGSTPYSPFDPKVRTIIGRKLGRLNAADYAYYSSYGRFTRDETLTKEATRMCAIWNSSWSHHLNTDDVKALIKADRLWDFTRVWRPDMRKNAAKHPNGWLKKSNGYIPTPQEVNDWSLEGFGHDSSNCHIVIKAEMKRLGQPSECAHCKGEGYTWPDKKTKWHYDHWKRKEPPEGEGYQIWETISEGSPISPVFATPEELARHMAGTRWGGDEGTPYETWLAFIRGPGWAPTMVSDGTRMMSGVEAVCS